MSHVYAMGEALQKNELICLHADRFLEGNKTIVKNFLGEEANFPQGPFLLSSSFKVPVSVVFAFKESTYSLSFLRKPVYWNDPGTNQKPILWTVCFQTLSMNLNKK